MSGVRTCLASPSKLRPLTRSLSDADCTSAPVLFVVRIVQKVAIGSSQHCRAVFLLSGNSHPILAIVATLLRR